MDAAFVPPPPSLQEMGLPPPPPSTSASAALAEFNEDSTISEEVVREALLDLVRAHLCWGDAAAKHMIIGKVEAFPALHYKLESFCEERKTQVVCLDGILLFTFIFFSLFSFSSFSSFTFCFFFLMFFFFRRNFFLLFSFPSSPHFPLIPVSPLTRSILRCHTRVVRWTVRTKAFRPHLGASPSNRSNSLSRRKSISKFLTRPPSLTVTDAAAKVIYLSLQRWLLWKMLSFSL